MYKKYSKVMELPYNGGQITSTIGNKQYNRNYLYDQLYHGFD